MNLCCRVNDMGKKETVPQVRFKGFDGEWVQADAGFIFDTRDDRRHPELPVLAATQELGMVPGGAKSIMIFPMTKRTPSLISG